jgi:hypothetical protein
MPIMNKNHVTHQLKLTSGGKVVEHHYRHGREVKYVKDVMGRHMIVPTKKRGVVMSKMNGVHSHKKVSKKVVAESIGHMLGRGITVM